MDRRARETDVLRNGRPLTENEVVRTWHNRNFADAKSEAGHIGLHIR